MLSNEEIERCAQASKDLHNRATECGSVQTELLDKILVEYRSLRQELEECKARCKDATAARNALSGSSHRTGAATSDPDLSEHPPNPFVLVLVDGDEYGFHNGIASPGPDYGATAAEQLEKVISAFEDPLPDGQKPRVLAKVFANLAGLDRTICTCHSGITLSHLQKFAHGFSNHKAGFDFCDTKLAKNKVTVTATLPSTIFFKKNPKLKDKLRIITDNDSGFPCNAGPGSIAAVNLSEVLQRMTSVALYLQNAAGRISTSKLRLDSAMPSNDETNLIALNAKGHRLDALPVKYDQASADQNQKLYNFERPCVKYILNGVCGQPDCKLSHMHVSRGAIEHIRFAVRSVACVRGGACRISGCNYGHVCHRFDCKGPAACYFPPRMHHVDNKITHWVPPDSSSTQIYDAEVPDGGSFSPKAQSTENMDRPSKEKDLNIVKSVSSGSVSEGPARKIAELLERIPPPRSHLQQPQKSLPRETSLHGRAGAALATQIMCSPPASTACTGQVLVGNGNDYSSIPLHDDGRLETPGTARDDRLVANPVEDLMVFEVDF